MTAVFDCVVLLQAAGRPGGPAGACFAHAEAGRVRLVTSDEAVAELADVLSRPKVRRAFPRVTDAVSADFLARVGRASTRFPVVPAAVVLARDPKDEKYLNLAVAANADAVVTWDRDLLDPMTGADPDAVAFRTAHPTIDLLTPPAFLALLPSIP